MDKDYDYLLKIVIVGDASVGKSCLLHRFTDDKFLNNYQATLGVDFKFKTVTYGGKVVKLQIWDTAGQDRFKNIVSSYYKNSNAIIVVYDVTYNDSLQNIESFWLDEIQNNVENVDLILLGNKSDLIEQREVSVEQAERVAKENNMDHYLVSAKTAENVQLAINKVIQKCLVKEQKKIDNLKLSKEKARNKSGCC